MVQILNEVTTRETVSLSIA